MTNITSLFNSLLNKKQGNNHEAAALSISDDDTNTIGFQQKPRPVLKPAPVRKPVVLPSPSPSSMITLPPSRDPVTPDDSAISRPRATPDDTTTGDNAKLLQDFLESLKATQSQRAKLPDLPIYQGHDKHGVGERIVSFFRGGREGGLGGAIQGARDPGQMEHRDWVNNKYAPALAGRQQLATEQKEQDTSNQNWVKTFLESLKEGRENRKQRWEENKPISLPNNAALVSPQGKQLYSNVRPEAPKVDTSTIYARQFNPETGKLEYISGPDGKPLRSREYEQALANQAGQDRRNTATNQTRIKTTAMTQAGQNYRHNNPVDTAGQKLEAEKQAWLDALQNAIQSSNGVKDSEAIQNAVEHLRKYPDIEVGEGDGGWPYAKRIAKASTTKAPTSGKVFPAHQLESYAKAHGATVEEAKRYLEAQGYAIR